MTKEIPREEFGRGDQHVAITLSGCFTHDATPLFKNLHFEIITGHWTCLLGPSGVGKTTVLRLLAGLPTGGTFTGTIETDDSQPLAGRIAYMAQSDFLAPWLSVRDNVLIGTHLRDEILDTQRADHLIEQVGLRDHATKKPGELSGGMRQRAALARTLLEDRPVALLDEPFSALDARTRAEMQELTFEMLSGRTVLLVTHDPGEAVRLGHAITVMTESGLQHVTPPSNQPVRPYDDAKTLHAQVELLNLLRSPEGKCAA